MQLLEEMIINQQQQAHTTRHELKPGRFLAWSKRPLLVFFEKHMQNYHTNSTNDIRLYTSWSKHSIGCSVNVGDIEVA